MKKICDHCEHDPFFSNFSPVFEIPDSLDWFKKNKTKLKQNSNNFNHSLFFPPKSCFSLLLIIVLQRNMRSLWTWPFFLKIHSTFWVSRLIRLVQKNETNLKQISNNFNQSLFFFASKCFSLLLIIFIQSFRHCINQVLVSEVSSQSRCKGSLKTISATES